MTGIPITNVNNNCSTGSTAFFQANSWVRGGIADCTLALGFERMAPGSLGTHFPDRPPPMMPFSKATYEIEDATTKNHGPMAPRMFANGAQEYFNKYGGTIDHLAEIGTRGFCCTIQLTFDLAAKNHKHSVNNEYSQFRTGWSKEDILAAPKINEQLTKLMCSPTSVRRSIVHSSMFTHHIHYPGWR